MIRCPVQASNSRFRGSPSAIFIAKPGASLLIGGVLATLWGQARIKLQNAPGVARLTPIVFPPNLSSHDFAKIETVFPHSRRLIFNAEPGLRRSVS